MKNMSTSKYYMDNQEFYYTNNKEILIANANLLIYDDVFIIALQYNGSFIDSKTKIIFKSFNVRGVIIIAKKLDIPVFKHKIAKELALTIKTNDYISGSVFFKIVEFQTQVYHLKYEVKTTIKNWWFYFYKGIYYCSKRNYNKAIIKFTKSLELNPMYIKAYHYRGTAYKMLGDYKRATEDYEKMFKLESSTNLLSSINNDKFEEILTNLKTLTICTNLLN